MNALGQGLEHGPHDVGLGLLGIHGAISDTLTDQDMGLGIGAEQSERPLIHGLWFPDQMQGRTQAATPNELGFAIAVHIQIDIGFDPEVLLGGLIGGWGVFDDPPAGDLLDVVGEIGGGAVRETAVSFRILAYYYLICYQLVTRFRWARAECRGGMLERDARDV